MVTLPEGSILVKHTIIAHSQTPGTDITDPKNNTMQYELSLFDHLIIDLHYAEGYNKKALISIGSIVDEQKFRIIDKFIAHRDNPHDADMLESYIRRHYERICVLQDILRERMEDEPVPIYIARSLEELKFFLEMNFPQYVSVTDAYIEKSKIVTTLTKFFEKL